MSHPENGSSKKKIMIFESYPGQLYGSQQDIISWFKHVDRNLFELILVTPCAGRLTEALSRLGKKVIVCEQQSILHRYSGQVLSDGLPGRFRTALALMKYSRKIADILRQEKIDGVLCNDIRSFFMVALATKLKRKPLLLYIKGEFKNPFLDRVAVLVADGIILVSQLLSVRYRRLFKLRAENVHHLPIGIDCAGNYTLRRDEQSKCGQDKPVRFAFVGRVSRAKGIDKLIEAMSIVVKSNPETELYIVGDCADQKLNNELRAFVSAEGLEERVHWLGWRADVPQILAQMHVLVLPSQTEGTPRSIGEALSLGKVVIATPVGGVPEQLGYGSNGILVEQDDAVSVAQEMLRVAIDSSLRERLGKSAWIAARNMHGVQLHTRGLESILHRYVGCNGTKQVKHS
jgi:glycosyltransferase involved in cell wall biosynthesis